MQRDSNHAESGAMKPWEDDLVCPVCFATLRFSETTVTCSGCTRVYPVVDGIPVLIPERASLDPS